MFSIRVFLTTVTTVGLLATTTALADGEHEDITVGVTGGGQLAAHFEWDEVHELPFVDDVLHGWLGDDPGFVHLEEDEPGEDFYMLADGVDVYFEVVSFDAAFQAWGPGFTGPYADPGDQVYLGDAELHDHLEWHINADDPAYDPGAAPWQAHFRLVDQGSTGYLPSETYTLSFVPEPASAALLLIGGLAIGRRRRADWR